YGYTDALRDGVVRPVLFMAYSGDMRWRTRAGEEVAARLGEPLTKDLITQAWRTALDPNGEWIPARSEEHTSELQSRFALVCRLLLEKKTRAQRLCHLTTQS